jgi:hypothetical protein
VCGHASNPYYRTKKMADFHASQTNTANVPIYVYTYAPVVLY